MAENNHGTDGALDRMLRLGQRQKAVPAIFIHAGAGFHSHQNEHVHLEACVAAAEMGMKFLKAGAAATEAVEAALRILEDREITNAGYGSNLSIDGTVECDATIVDHLGRSGACGAVPNIRNPISLAKLILDTSSQPLSLRRVPPNALVGEGARIFAEEHGVVTFANEYLVSKNSRDRFFRWQEDLLRAEERIQDSRTGVHSPSATMACVPCQYDTASAAGTRKPSPRQHTVAIMAGTWNEGQPDSPYAGTPASDPASMQDDSFFSPRANASLPAPTSKSPRPSPRSPLSSAPMADSKSAGASPTRTRYVDRRPNVAVDSSSPTGTVCRSAPEILRSNNGFAPDSTSCLQPMQCDDASSISSGMQGVKRSLDEENQPRETDGPVAKRQVRLNSRDEDMITDTIGAIAIDDQGRIAAGSSSGGIGMKHRGRLGPAALVGIGTAVVPCAEDDEDGITVAAVTSGTGEHMATTMASQRCAERIYTGTRRAPGGGDVQDDDEDAIMESFISKDFMGHPGVKNCNSQGAIGVMVVKKSRTGYYLYFAHNTDSFALASMGALEKEPRCTMSRLPDGAKIAKGGRKIRIS
ncbi:asparaginase family protein [Metarhizium album ARSEF 1941]|uniref:Asparaginase family protein n=1 Tax=Metarhizium album (strain ARSEF 1941) TaxID=1081103 RepID=A0A0B2X203_METAS|nr:asparaginase family protein [Metarhizium album ARSEF 1941]KHN99210.1 asparaginase family protein [Metarhizium album ARSEF 1941]